MYVCIVYTICVCMTCMYVCITCVCMCVCMDKYEYACMCGYVCMCVYGYEHYLLCVCMDVYTYYVDVSMCMYVCMYVYNVCKHSCVVSCVVHMCRTTLPGLVTAVLSWPDKPRARRRCWPRWSPLDSQRKWSQIG